MHMLCGQTSKPFRRVAAGLADISSLLPPPPLHQGIGGLESPNWISCFVDVVWVSCSGLEVSFILLTQAFNVPLPGPVNSVLTLIWPGSY